MAKTLADMATEERAECVGMWCECTTGHSKHIAVLLNDSGLIIFPHLLKSGTLEIGLITPRFDLPRAWRPDGRPVPGEWEKSTAELPTKDYKATFTQHYRRWVGEWEQDND